MFTIFYFGEVLVAPTALLIYIIYRAAADKERKRLAKYVMQMICLACLIAYLAWGAFPNPAIRLSKLQGLTPDEVISRIGPPYSDPRKPDAQGRIAWSAEGQLQGTDGPLAFSYSDSASDDWFPYRWGGYHYAVIFQDNRVVLVRVARK